jgi:hypothetical protein
VNESPAAAAPTPSKAAVTGPPPLTAQKATRGTQPPHTPALAGSSNATRTSQAATTAARIPQTAATARNASGFGAGGGSRASNAATAARDTDVTLLTALVAHANEPTVTVAERSRDVVERNDGDTTAQLLERCRQLGVIEGMLCRSRICSGRWDQDAACRAPSH